MIFLDLDDLLHVAARVLPEVLVRDAGLLEAALARPRATAFGADAYPDLHTKAAALMHSLAGNHGLVDGNKRLALAAAIAFLGMNGQRLTLSNDEAYELVTAVASGQLDDVDSIARRLRDGSRPRT
ncbi:MAG: type II toxin-antitoxin system death-on-curing family toxin [Candidatus Nanopelagicales bacterium]